MKEKKIETLIINYASNVGGLTFEEVLLRLSSSRSVQRRPNDRDIEFRLISPYDDINGEFVVGVIITTKKSGLPPKHDTNTGETEPLGLNDGEGLGYANVILYEKSRNLLFYELNKNGTYLNQFIEFVEIKSFDLYNPEMPPGESFYFNMSAAPLLKAESYNRVLRLNSYREFELEIANPREFMTYVDHSTTNGKALLEVTNQSILLNAPVFKIIFKSGRKATSQLAAAAIRKLIRAIHYGMKTPKGEDIKKVKIVGFSTDPDDNNVKQNIDLLTDRYIKKINLREPRELIDLQEGERREQIVYLYRSCLDELSRLI